MHVLGLVESSSGTLASEFPGGVYWSMYVALHGVFSMLQCCICNFTCKKIQESAYLVSVTMIAAMGSHGISLHHHPL